jgi:hypothetical protein
MSFGPIHWLVLAFVTLSLYYNIATPLFEAPDEADHYRFARWLAAGKAYPDLIWDAPAAGHEIWQTPLYYYVLSPVVGLMQGGEPYDIAPLNPGYPAYSLLVHTHTAAELFPYTGTALAVHLARLVTALFGVGVILATYGLAKSVWPPAALTAAALVAFNPQFVFMSSVINNDVPAACLAALTVWWLFRGFHQAARGTNWALTLGALWGLAILTKLNNVMLVVPIGLGLLAVNWPVRRLWRRGLIEGVLLAVPVLLLAGWWFVLNQTRYQDWLAWQPMLNTVSGLQRAQLLSWDQALTYSAGLLTSFWLIIGYGFRGPDGFYVFFDVLMLAAVLGLGLWTWAQLRQRSSAVLLPVGILGAWVVAAFVSLLQWMRILEGTDQGRLVFPVISGLAVLLALGMTRLTWPSFRRERRFSQRFSPATAAVVGLFVCALATPFVVIRPAYAQPTPQSAEVALPSPRAIELGGEIQLRGFELSPDRLTTPGVLTVDLYWDSVKPPSADYVVRLTLVDPAGRTPAIVDAMPFAGRYPTTLWRPDRLLHDRMLIAIPPLDQPGLVTAYLSAYPIGKGRELLEAVEHGEALDRYIELGRIKLRGSTFNAQPQQKVEAHLGDEVELQGFDAPVTLEAGRPVSVTLHWRAARQPTADYTVFMHLLDPAGNVVAQDDSQPQQGQYPTSYWDEGEQVRDVHELALPPGLTSGEYRVQVGMYRLATGERLPARQDNGKAWPDNAILLKTYHVP